MFLSSSLQKASRLLTLAALAAIAAVPAAADFFPLYPDACTSQLTPGTVEDVFLPALDTRIYWTPLSLPENKLVLIVSGNGMMGGDYAELAEHLAQNGFIAAVFHRPGDIFDVLDGVLAEIGVAKTDPDLEIALVGHSFGGREVIEAARDNTDDDLGYPILALATLAPVASIGTIIDGDNVRAYLSIYGSQDEDVDGYDGTVNEAFYAYDTAGTESSTTCNSPPCMATVTPFEKTMVFVYGDDHPSLVGEGIAENLEDPQNLEYLALEDGLCITKAYLTGFLRLHLWGESIYRGMLRGSWKPPSVSSIVTNEADGFGNPAGSPLRLFLQNSPVQHKTIQNFSTGLGPQTRSPSAFPFHRLAGSLSGSPYFIRHQTAFATVAWNGATGNQWVRFEVPAGSRSGSTYTHFSLRLGQVSGVVGPYANALNTDQEVWVGLEDDNGQESWHLLTGIPAPDRYTEAGPVVAQSHFSTRRIPVSAIHGIDLSDVRGIYLYFEQGTAGTLMVDNLEWHRD